MFDQLQLHQALRDAVPGTVVEIVTLRITVPSGRDTGEGDVPGGDTPGVTHAATAGPENVSSPLHRLREIVGAEGPLSRKESEWALGICSPRDFSARELDRACQMGAIKTERKGWGKDAGARMIDSTALEQYLILRDDVQQGRTPEPSWWEKVVLKASRSTT